MHYAPATRPIRLSLLMQRWTRGDAAESQPRGRRHPHPAPRHAPPSPRDPRAPGRAGRARLQSAFLSQYEGPRPGAASVLGSLGCWSSYPKGSELPSSSRWGKKSEEVTGVSSFKTTGTILPQREEKRGDTKTPPNTKFRGTAFLSSSNLSETNHTVRKGHFPEKQSDADFSPPGTPGGGLRTRMGGWRLDLCSRVPLWPRGSRVNRTRAS